MEQTPHVELLRVIHGEISELLTTVSKWHHHSLQPSEILRHTSRPDALNSDRRNCNSSRRRAFSSRKRCPSSRTVLMRRSAAARLSFQACCSSTSAEISFSNSCKCSCLRRRDRRALSRFDNIRLAFRCSFFPSFGSSSEPSDSVGSDRVTRAPALVLRLPRACGAAEPPALAVRAGRDPGPLGPAGLALVPMLSGGVPPGSSGATPTGVDPKSVKPMP
mmetsp:Transcript_39262/g.116810  ORF Transcript_39262/g.116810 Transcript_39262/m.116810 type:complete len:219 (-) Transcript_39262:340-996(-)